MNHNYKDDISTIMCGTEVGFACLCNPYSIRVTKLLILPITFVHMPTYIIKSKWYTFSADLCHKVGLKLMDHHRMRAYHTAIMSNKSMFDGKVMFISIVLCSK